MAKVPRWRTEAEMCGAFIEALPTEVTAYPETAGWDILGLSLMVGLAAGYWWGRWLWQRGRGGVDGNPWPPGG